ncbi:MAG TPA: TRAP transporter small permease subunit, partial [Alphaproteobacteria bacterium]|nr:TRAP transporter small permease subunit [Alphaproteobacteria bacterium]
MSTFVRLIHGLSRLCGVVAVALIALSIVIVCQMVFVRALLGQSVIWQTEFVTFSLIAATFIGAPYVLLTRGHVNVELLPLYLGHR